MLHLPFEIKLAAHVVAYHRAAPNDTLVTCQDHDEAVSICLEKEAEYPIDNQLINDDKDNFAMLYWRSLFAKSAPSLNNTHGHACGNTFDMTVSPKQFCLKAPSVDSWLQSFTVASEDTDGIPGTPTPNRATLTDPPHYIILDEDTSIEGTDMETPASSPDRSLLTSPAPLSGNARPTLNMPVTSNQLPIDKEETVTITRAEFERSVARTEELNEAVTNLGSTITSLTDMIKKQAQPQKSLDPAIIGFFDPTGAGLPEKSNLAENMVYSEGRYTCFTDVYLFTDQLKRMASQYGEEQVVTLWPSCLKHRALVWFYSELDEDARANISKRNLAHSVDILTERWKRSSSGTEFCKMRYTLEDAAQGRDILKFCAAVIGVLRHNPRNSEFACLLAWSRLSREIQQACAGARPNQHTRPSEFYKNLREQMSTLQIAAAIHGEKMLFELEDKF